MKKALVFSMLALAGCAHVAAPVTAPSPAACKQTIRAYILAEQADCYHAVTVLGSTTPPIGAAIIAKDNAFCKSIPAKSGYDAVSADACVAPGHEYVPRGVTLRRAR